MKLRRILILFILMLLLVTYAAATPYEPSTSEEAKFVPTYIRQGDSIQMLYNADTAEMAIDLCVASKDIQNGYDESADWMALMHGYGYRQLYKVENNKPYELGYLPVEGGGKLFITYQAVNALVGIREVQYNGQNKYAVVIAFRGTTDVADIIADLSFIAGEDNFHTGFIDNARDMFENICPTITFEVEGKTVTLSQIIADMKNEDSKYCMLVTGHSLGGALTDVFVGHELYDAGVHPSNVVAYAFAPAKSAPAIYDYPYTNIFNIINEDDTVPHIGADCHVGTDIYYKPDDAFRQAHYAAFEAGHDSFWWRNPLNGLTHKFSAHYGHGVYRNIVKEINRDQAAYFHYSTTGDNTWGSWDGTDLYQDCFGSFEGSITTNGPVNFHGASLCVGGDLLMDHTISMHDYNDYLLVEGDWELEPRMEDDAEHLTAGTVELRGNMDVEWLHGGRGYYETGTHRTFFTGDTHQSIRAGSTGHSQFENLYIKNPYVDFELAIRQLKLREDTKIVSTPKLHITDALELNGHTLTVEHPVLEMTLSSENTLQGTMLISGNLLAQDTLTFDGAEVRITGDCELEESLVMQKDEDYLLVRGHFVVDTCETLQADHLTAGTVEVKGNFTQNDPIMTGSDWYGYYETGTHKTILSGDKTQEVTFRNSTPYNQMENLYLENEKIRFGYFNRIRLAADATVTETETFGANGSLNLNGHTLHLTGSADIHVLEPGDGRLEVEQNLNLRDTSIDGTIWVGGNLTAVNALVWNHASVEVLGDATFDKSLYMQHEDDYLLVHGLCGVDTWNTVTEDHLSAGTVELKGDFETLWHVERGYWETGTHQTIFSGDGTQNVFIRGTSNCQFENLYLKNPNVSFGSSIPNLKLREDTVITGTQALRIDRELELNGHTLTVTHPELTMSLNQPVTLHGALRVSGDLLAEQAVTFADGTLTVGGDCEIRDSITMHHDDDYMLVGGNLTLETREDTPTERLTAGTLEVKGDFTVHSGEKYAYYATGTHRTVCSGTGTQNVSVAGAANRIENLAAENESVTLAYIYHLGLAEDAVIAGRLAVATTLDLKGHTLTTTGDVDFDGQRLDGTLRVGGNLILKSCTLSGLTEVSGNAEVTDCLTFAGGRLDVQGDCEIGNGLIMRSEDDYLFVGGNFRVESRTCMAEDHLSAGTVEVQGDFRQYAPNLSVRSYGESGTHRTILSGSDVQMVWFNSPCALNRFENLYLPNPYVDFTSSQYQLILREDTAILSTSTLNVQTLDLNGYALIYNGTLKAKTTKAEDSAAVHVAVEDGVVTARGFADADTPVHVLVTGYTDKGQLAVCEVLTFRNEAEMTETMDTTVWGSCTVVRTMILGSDYKPVCPVLPVV